MAQGKIVLKPGTLWKRIKEQTENALKCGALLSIPTDFEFVEQNGIKFIVRILSNLTRKDTAKQQKKKTNPFLPYEQDLFVADISQTHVCILNKFNVVDYHLLIITRAFEEQEKLLTLEDFAAMWACLAEFEGLAFYNGGKIAGASQPHKHLQIVPLPLTPSGVQIPIEPLLTSAQFADSVTTVPELPFIHALAKLDPNWSNSPLEAAAATLGLYESLLSAVGLEAVDDNRQSGAYNLLATREWMLIVPRSHEHFDSISVNSLGFAGALLVRNEQQMQIIKEQGPMTILQNVALPVV
ncbi:phosphorylase [Nodularia spumigena CS-591/04]|uniref:ATP adenylyltransferase family protein n=1 Tax=Nodularia spumigena TaxID=70799 RepID=UPI0023315139|nr:phosphorylase [Nodularia spumigena]MDB9322755.1 phosphorylase [Nodularia spumigena CS-591/07A]MDB9330054.1 phosphorylase [Nodularia spumigena CS-591/04]MDB9360659.1 phosphorylase [Nodularia spumigena CS-588/02]MDB9365375.1 phosphorylase [Nodularia spumigena CS-588/02A10]